MRIGYRAIGMAFGLLVGTAFADTVLWDEAADGELASFGAGGTSIPGFVLGTNIVRGTFGSEGDEDVAYNSLPVGLKITGGEIEIISAPASVFVAALDVVPFDGNTELSKYSPPLGTSALTTPGASLPFTAPNWRWYLRDGLTAGFGATYEMRIFVQSISTSPVPEPGTLALSGLAVAGVLAERRRRKRRA